MIDGSTAPDPLLDESSLPFGAPAFDRITPAQFLPALNRALGSAQSDIDTIADNPAAASFNNTIVELERAGGMLARVRRIFWALGAVSLTRTALHTMHLGL